MRARKVCATYGVTYQNGYKFEEGGLFKKQIDLQTAVMPSLVRSANICNC